MFLYRVFSQKLGKGHRPVICGGGGFSSPIHRKGKKNPRGKKKPSCIKADVHVVSSDILSVTANLL